MRPKFRETLWFKKGQLDAEAAQRASAPEEEEAQVAADSLPIEDRYNDDGSLQPHDSLVFGVHTGTTRALVRMQPVLAAPVAEAAAAVVEPPRVPERLISEMKTGRRWVLAMIAGAAVAIGGLAIMML